MTPTRSAPAPTVFRCRSDDAAPAPRSNRRPRARTTGAASSTAVGAAARRAKRPAERLATGAGSSRTGEHGGTAHGRDGGRSRVQARGGDASRPIPISDTYTIGSIVPRFPKSVFVLSTDPMTSHPPRHPPQSSRIATTPRHPSHGIGHQGAGPCCAGGSGGGGRGTRPRPYRPQRRGARVASRQIGTRRGVSRAPGESPRVRKAITASSSRRRT